MIFEKWLLKQRKRNDPIGDLARDFASHKQWHPRLKLTREVLVDEDACQGAFDALEQATCEWEIDNT